MNIELSFILFLQTKVWALILMKFASYLGSREFMLLAMPFLYWCWDARRGFRVALILVISQGLNVALKIALHSPRPYWIDPDVRALSSEPSFGMPSGHAQNAICIWGKIACFIQRPWAYALAIGTCLLIGVSRTYLGVHFFSDVIGGWAVGAILLGSSAIGEPFLVKKLRNLDLKQQATVSFLASLSIIVLYAISQATTGNWHLPAVWAANALEATGKTIDPLSSLDAFNAAGLLFGTAVGYAILQNSGGFRADGPIYKRLMRYFLGMIGVGLIWYGLGMAIQVLPAGYISAYLRSTLAGFWVTVGAPLIFIKLNLAERIDGPS